MKLTRGGLIAVGSVTLVFLVVAGPRLTGFGGKPTARLPESSPQSQAGGASVPVGQQAVVRAPGDTAAEKSLPASNGQTQAAPAHGFSGGKGAGELSPHLKTQLAEYAKLHRQVLPKADSETAKSRLLHDEQLLAGLLPVLSAPASTSQEIEWQNGAIDLLLEARAQTASEAALAALRSIIEDPRIERNDVSRVDRMALAGIKAEVMYRWLAQEPARSDEIHRLLPGPVSRTIWDNVIAAQKQNQLESVALALPGSSRGGTEGE